MPRETELVDIEVVFLQYNKASLLVRDTEQSSHTAIIPFSLITGGCPEGLAHGEIIAIEIPKWLAEREELV